MLEEIKREKRTKKDCKFINLQQSNCGPSHYPVMSDLFFVNCVYLSLVKGKQCLPPFETSGIKMIITHSHS